MRRRHHVTNTGLTTRWRRLPSRGCCSLKQSPANIRSSQFSAVDSRSIPLLILFQRRPVEFRIPRRRAIGTVLWRRIGMPARCQLRWSNTSNDCYMYSVHFELMATSLWRRICPLALFGLHCIPRYPMLVTTLQLYMRFLSQSQLHAIF